MITDSSIDATRKSFEESFSSGDFYNRQTQDSDHLAKISRTDRDHKCRRREADADSDRNDDYKPDKNELREVDHAESETVFKSSLNAVVEPCHQRIHERQCEDERKQGQERYDHVPVGKPYVAPSEKCEIDIESGDRTVNKIEHMHNNSVLKIVLK